MSLFRNARPSRREILKQSGMIAAVSTATAVSPLVASAWPSCRAAKVNTCCR